MFCMLELGWGAGGSPRANGSWNSLDAIDALVVPDDLAAALAARSGAREHFDADPASVRKMALGWIYQAKRARTRTARVEQIAAFAERGETIMSLYRYRRRD
jgi:uncharacterized protein YdeI (YjbR/CyaY-like superfamily)